MNAIKRIIILAGSMCFWAVWSVWKWVYRIAGKKPPGIGIVLYYHSVSTEQVTRFAKQMDDLIRWAQPARADFKYASGDGAPQVAVTFDDGLQSIVENAIPELIHREIPATLFIPTGYLAQSPGWEYESGDQNCNDKVITVDSLRRLPSAYISVGSHSVTHPDMTVLSENLASKELRDSREKLSKILGRNVKHFSFPYGAHNDKVVDLARRAGYTRVYTILPTLTYLATQNYVTGRVPVDPRDWRLEFCLKMLGAYCWLPYAFAWKRKLLRVFNKLYAPIMSRSSSLRDV